jgi:hypothetical protein
MKLVLKEVSSFVIISYDKCTNITVLTLSVHLIQHVFLSHVTTAIYLRYVIVVNIIVFTLFIVL